MRIAPLVIALSWLTCPGTLAAQQPAKLKAPAELKTPEDHRSYAIGLDVGRSIRQDRLQLDIDKLIMGLRDGLTGAPSKLTDQQLTAAMRSIDAELQRRVADEAKNNLQKGREFLAENKQKPGVVTLPSGLQYQVLKSGAGPSPTATDTVTTHYHGTLIDGTVFDSSVQRGEPASFPVNRVIKGWTEALQKMKVGDKWRLFIPSELAYGERGAGPIAANCVLIFEIELLGIKQ